MYAGHKGLIKGFLRSFWHTRGFINLNKINELTYTLRMKPTENFINENPSFPSAQNHEFISLTLAFILRILLNIYIYKCTVLSKTTNELLTFMRH